MYDRSFTNAPVFGLRREIDRLFEDTFGRADAPRGGIVPPVDVHEDAESLHLAFEMPGVRPDQVEVTADQGVLTVRGEKRRVPHEGEGTRAHVAERSHGRFMRSFQLPPGLDAERIEATFEHGVLMVTVPKKPAPKPRRIEVRTGGGQQQQRPQQQQVGTGARGDESARDGEVHGRPAERPARRPEREPQPA